MRGAEVRLAELLAALSLAFDLGLGRPLEHTLRATYLAGRLSQRLGLSEDERGDVFYASVLQNVGCIAYTPELVRTFVADDIVAAAASPFLVDPLPLVRFMASHVGSAGPLYARPGTLVRALATGQAAFREHDRAFCEVGALLARRLGLGEGVARTLLTLYERWDGRGFQGMRGADIPVATRIIAVATHAEIYFTAAGEDAALSSVEDRAEGWFDPEIAASFWANARARPEWAALDAPTFWEDVLAMEPAGLRRTIEDHDVDGIAEAFADFIDMKSPSYFGHSRAVARLAERAARLLRLPEQEVVAVRRAGLLHDIGRIAVSNTILEKRRALTPAEQEKVRLHPYYAERVLTRTPPLADLAPLAGAHHERLDGSGYHRGARAAQLPVAARVIA
ncbi:MAG: HD-GYP domain-containing protein, partial [Candidatus Limnocylindria bacterium]